LNNHLHLLSALKNILFVEREVKSHHNGLPIRNDNAGGVYLANFGGISRIIIIVTGAALRGDSA
jgi:hypothetical protein